jgi:hypothetical protein
MRLTKESRRRKSAQVEILDLEYTAGSLEIHDKSFKPRTVKHCIRKGANNLLIRNYLVVDMFFFISRE